MKRFALLALAALMFAPSAAVAQSAFTYDHAVAGTVLDVASGQHALTGMWLGNGATTVCYLQIFNATAANVTLGSTVPKQSIFLPAGGGGNNAKIYAPVYGVAMSVAATTTRAGATPCTVAVDVDLEYN